MTAPPKHNAPRPLLLFGASGQVGRELRRALAPLGSVVAPSHAEVDLTDARALREIIEHVQPAAIVNSAALTNVDRAEREPDLARALNEVAPGIMAQEAARIGALVVHYSTDYVFDGDADMPYAEDSTPNPINTYGESKLGGERAVASSGAPHLIIRTSWVYSADGNGFVPTLLRQLRDQREFRVVADQTGSPTWSRSLAATTVSILGALASGDGFDLPDADFGVYHLGGSGVANRVAIANELIEAVFSETESRPVVIPISAAEFAAAARRPGYSAISNDRAARRFGVTLGPWQTELRQMVASRA